MTDNRTAIASRHGPDRTMVCVVDDDPAQRRDLADYLRHQGIRVLEIADGALAVREIERLKPALVLMDYRMPGCDGVRATGFAQLLSPATMIVLMSGDGEAVDRANTTLSYPVPVLQKPLTLSRVADFVAGVLSNSWVAPSVADAAAGAEGHRGFCSAVRS